jgi:hypothetical protein
LVFLHVQFHVHLRVPGDRCIDEVGNSNPHGPPCWQPRPPPRPGGGGGGVIGGGR